MSADDDWTMTLFPSLPLALLALVRTTPSPSLVLVEDRSILNSHVSALSLPQQGYLIRTFTEQATLELPGRQRLVPSFRLAVHHNLDALYDRLSAQHVAIDIEKMWNHVENLSESDLFERSTTRTESFDSATLRLPGCPGAAALLLRGKKRANMQGVIEGLGLQYQDGQQL